MTNPPRPYTVAGQVLDMVSFVLGQLCVAHGNLSCRKGRMLPHTGLFLLWKVALQMRIRWPFLCFEVVKSILDLDRHFAHDGFVIECLSANHGRSRHF